MVVRRCPSTSTPLPTHSKTPPFLVRGADASVVTDGSLLTILSLTVRIDGVIPQGWSPTGFFLSYVIGCGLLKCCWDFSSSSGRQECTDAVYRKRRIDHRGGDSNLEPCTHDKADLQWLEAVTPLLPQIPRCWIVKWCGIIVAAILRMRVEGSLEFFPAANRFEGVEFATGGGMVDVVFFFFLRRCFEVLINFFPCLLF